MVRWLILCLLVAAARAEPGAEEPARAVALLPLDADAKLELYGQPVASEVSRALVAGGIEVVVVGPKMAVPAKARVIVDGTIKARGSAIELVLRVRDSKTGAVIDSVNATAPSQTAMDHAAEELSAKALPSVKANLAKLIAADDKAAAKPVVALEPKPLPPPPEKQRTMLIALDPSLPGDATAAALRMALETGARSWATKRHHDATSVEPGTAGGKDMWKAVRTRQADLGIELDVRDIVIDDRDSIPVARAAVRVRISDPQSLLFDRVIVTDSIPGEKAMDRAKLIERTAREVLQIVDPHVHRRIPAWF